MKKFLIVLVIVLGVSGVGAYLFREPLMQAVVERVTADMFVSRDTDAYDPGVAVGEPFPALRARFEAREVTAIDEFVGDRGTVVFVNRSVDW
jgi:hypothetical protein